MTTSPAQSNTPKPFEPQVQLGDTFVALMYHNVYSDRSAHSELSPSATSYFVHRTAFDEQLKDLSECGAAALRWEGLRAFYGFNSPTARPAGIELGRHQVLLTFDDGWEDAVEVGGPALAQFEYQAILFVTTDFLGRPFFLNRRQVARVDSRLFRIGSHARTHRMLSLLSEAEIRAELGDSKKILEDLVGYEVDVLSIPSGAVDGRVRHVAAECGYRLLFDSEVRVNRRGQNPLKAGRIAIMEHTTLSSFRRYVRQRVGRERLRRTLLHAPKKILGLRQYEAIRRHLLGEKCSQQVTHQS